MAYEYKKNLNGEQDLVINGFEKGIAQSPFTGIADIKNLNVSFIEGIAYVSYKRQACTISGGTMAVPIYATQSPQGIIYIADNNKQVWKQSAVNSAQFNILSGNYTGENISGLQFWSNYLFVFYSSRLEVCGDGSGDGGISSGTWNTGASANGVWPIRSASITLTGTPAAGDTTAVISTYNDAQGNARAFWNGPTGTVFFTFFLSGFSAQTVVASVTQGSANVSWTPALNAAATSSSVGCEPLKSSSNDVGAGQHMSLVSINDGNMYFCHGAFIGAFQATPFQIMEKGNMKTFTYNCAALGLPRTDGSIWLTEIKNQLLIAGYHKIYPWDRISPQWNNPLPIYENIVKMTNILNNVYILAGVKGNIYITNGYSAEPFFKMPDSITGYVDPQWAWGGIMENRNNLYFQALTTDSATGTNLFAGNYQLNLATKSLTMDSQFSGGTLPTGVVAGGIMVNNNNLTPLQYDNYYSGYGATTSRIDYNNTTLWSDNEAVIETDIIPIGTKVQPKTFASAEFKFDQPMNSGDSITLYARKSLSDTYVALGTTTTAVLSEFYSTVSFEKWEWIQFKITMSSNSSSSSSARAGLREIRIR